MIVDVVDEKNRTIATAARRNLFARRLNFRTVDILLRDIQERMVLQLLPPDHLRSPNCLGASVAGYLLAGETYSEAARRKLRAELGVTARIRGIGTFEMIDDGCHKFVGVFTGTLRQVPEFDKGEIADLVHMDTQELDHRIANSPSQFTATFLRAYEYYKRR
jgi:isopentenyl-diphosphate Delta-isomerase